MRETMNADTQIPADFTLQRDAWGQLAMTLADGRRLAGVEVARAFPISAPGEYVCIYDAEGHEVLCIEDPSALSPALLKILEEELARREFVPIVVRIEEVLADSDPSHWRVVTDRGPTTFSIEDADNDVRRLGPNSILLVDTHGIRYLIPDVRKLEAASRRILERYL
jgi:hypothetical protein